jgi:hypothetical protein
MTLRGKKNFLEATSLHHFQIFLVTVVVLALRFQVMLRYSKKSRLSFNYGGVTYGT